MIDRKLENSASPRVNRLVRWLLVVSTLVVVWQTCGAELGLLSSVIFYFSLRLMQRIADPFSLRQITIASFWYVTYLATIFYPAFFVYADQGGPFRATYLFGVESVLITVPFGALLASRFFRFRKQETEEFFRKVPDAYGSTHRVTRTFLVVFALGLGFALAHVSELKTVPLLYMLKNPGDLYSSILREDALKLLNSPLAYIYFLVGRSIFPFLIMVSLGCYLLNRRRRWLWIFIVTLMVGVLYASISLEKGLVAAIFLLLGLFLYIYHQGKINIKAVMSVLVLTFSFPFFVGLRLQQDLGITSWDVLRHLAARLFYGPAEVLYYYFEVFPAHVGYLYGRSVGKFAWLAGVQYFDTANYVGVYGWPQYLESASANATFIGNLHADFGLAGVIIGGVLAGFILYSSHIYLVRQPKSVFTIACYAFLMLAFFFLNWTALLTVLASDGVILVLFLTWLFTRAAREYRTSPSQAQVVGATHA